MSSPTTELTYESLAERMGVSIRPGQRDLVNAGLALQEGQALLVKAPTATGKTLAALMIAAIRARRGGERTVVATYTKLLQNQYRDKDLVSIQALFPTVVFATLKGADNYLCRARAGLIGNTRMRDAFAAEETDPGEVHDRPALWQAKAEARRCRKHTPEMCGYAAAKFAARQAHVVITNHAMTLVDSRVTDFGPDAEDNSTMFGLHSLLIVDEIHNYPRAADSFGTDEFRIADMVSELTRRGLHEEARTVNQVGYLIGPGEFGSDRLPKRDELERLAKMQEQLQAVPVTSDTTSSIYDWVATAINTIAGRSDGKMIATVAPQLRRDSAARTLKLAHVDIAPIAAWGLHRHGRAVLMMSATIGTPDQPTYVSDQCGVPARVLHVESALDYANQMTMRVWPVQDENMGATAKIAVEAYNGRTLILCRSWAMVNELTTYLSENTDLTILCQDRQYPSRNFDIVSEFRTDVHSVLIGTASFFEGIDVPGESLSQVLIARLPMLMTFDPINAARREKAGANFTRTMQIPHTALVLEQMAGRLIRSTTDTGMVVVLDPSATAGWGAKAVEQARASFGLR